MQSKLDTILTNLSSLLADADYASIPIAEAKTALKELIHDLIGEDETPNPEWELDRIEYGCNAYRAELREKAKNL